MTLGVGVTSGAGPLHGLKIVEMAGVGPGPMCAMLMADLGAQVVRIEKAGGSGLGIPRPRKYDLVLRSRPAVVVDVKSKAGHAALMDLISQADALMEGFRPGTMERLGLGPQECFEVNRRLTYGRVTGWGQDGPLADVAGHDLNYVALTGVLHAIGSAERPAIPLNLIGDYAGGALYLAFGILAAILEARSSGRGQVVDAAMVDGVASLSALFQGLIAAGAHGVQRGQSVLDGGAPFYGVYQCADDHWVSIAPIEPKFYLELLHALGIAPHSVGGQYEQAHWPQARRMLSDVFRTRTRAEWAQLLEHTNACFSQVLTFVEAPRHPHLAARGTFVEVDGVQHPRAAPRFSRTMASDPCAPDDGPQMPEQALQQWLDADAIRRHRENGAFG
ncbi:CaiB/BaiF CoA transferase family protein [Variovorax sp. VNK109]|uniref:CaiB/BaiF CoA transferase family protein n=1 Tax=Variovorax sp. VNK109 TaxID=3400919 RepID=UPI003C03E1A1